MSNSEMSNPPTLKPANSSHSTLSNQPNVDIDSTVIDSAVDATGLTCPLPLLKAKQALNAMSSGQCLQVIATDPGSVRDFKVFADLSGNQLLHSTECEGTYTYLLKKV